MINNIEKSLQEKFMQINLIAEKNTKKIMQAMQDNKLSTHHLNGSTGYGYGDEGREIIESIYAQIFNAEDALVRQQIVNGTHAISLALKGNLTAGDELISIGKPYDTLDKVIKKLMQNGINYKQIDKIDIATEITNLTKVVYITRSKGYTWQKSLNISEIGELISKIKSINSNIICIVDNCYGELVEEKEPTDVGADLAVGSLIKNLGGGLAKTGGYIVGKKDLVEKCAEELTTVSIGKEVGATIGVNHDFLQGLFLAPQVVANSIKGAILTAKIFEQKEYKTNPHSNDIRTDIVQAIELNDKQKLIRFCELVQLNSPIDSFVVPKPWDMPGYENQVIMAAGTFVQGSSIELTADAPIKPPYIVYLQGGLTYYHIKIALENIVNEIL